MGFSCTRTRPAGIGLLALLVAASAVVKAVAAKVHLVIAADTLDPKIGKNVEVDRDAVEFALRSASGQAVGPTTLFRLEHYRRKLT